MSDCPLPIGDNQYRCPVHHWIITVLPENLPVRCPGYGCERAASRQKGAGDFLHVAILKWVGEGPTRECGCVDRINQMNAWGPAGCREHLEEIVGWLVEEANKRGWWKYAVAVPGSRYFIERMVRGAIKKAERERNQPEEINAAR